MPFTLLSPVLKAFRLLQAEEEPQGSQTLDAKLGKENTDRSSNLISNTAEEYFIIFTKKEEG